MGEILQVVERCCGHCFGRMQAMVGFRNIAVHDDRKLDIAVLRAILDRRLGDFRDFCRCLLRVDM